MFQTSVLDDLRGSECLLGLGVVKRSHMMASERKGKIGTV